MSVTMEWKSDFLREVEQAEQARTAGNEGMARVCSRRAAGILVRAYFQANDIDLGSMNALEALRFLRDRSDQPEPVRETAGHFVMQITPDHVLPEDADLIADVRWLAGSLFPESS